MDNIIFEIVMHPDLSETFASLEESTLEYLMKCWEKIRISRFVDKDIQRQQDHLARQNNQGH